MKNQSRQKVYSPIKQDGYWICGKCRRPLIKKGIITSCKFCDIEYVFGNHPRDIRTANYTAIANQTKKIIEEKN